MPVDSNPVWFIADAASGLAAALAEAVLDAGHCAMLGAPAPGHLAALALRYPGRVEAVALDLADGASIDAALQAAERRFGAIDVLAASAFQRYLGAVEEGDEAALRGLFQENVFGPVALARRVLPAMRARRAGHVLLLARSAPPAPAGEGFCHAARAALEALAEAMSHEVERFGIGVTLVDAGTGEDGAWAPQPTRAAAIDDYADLAGRHAGTAPGAQVDSARAAQAILRAVQAGRGPLRLVLGRAALQRAYDRLRVMKVGFDAWAELAASADPEPAPAAARRPGPRAATSAGTGGRTAG